MIGSFRHSIRRLLDLEYKCECSQLYKLVRRTARQLAGKWKLPQCGMTQGGGMIRLVTSLRNSLFVNKQFIAHEEWFIKACNYALVLVASRICLKLIYCKKNYISTRLTNNKMLPNRKKLQLLPTRGVFIWKYQLQATFYDNGYQDGVKICIALLRDFQG